MYAVHFQENSYFNLLFIILIKRSSPFGNMLSSSPFIATSNVFPLLSPFACLLITAIEMTVMPLIHVDDFDWNSTEFGVNHSEISRTPIAVRVRFSMPLFVIVKYETSILNFRKLNQWMNEWGKNHHSNFQYAELIYETNEQFYKHFRRYFIEFSASLIVLPTISSCFVHWP